MEEYIAISNEKTDSTRETLEDIKDLTKPRNRPFNIRIWVVGCSAGEEAYSIAILIREALYSLKLRQNRKIQIYLPTWTQMLSKKARVGMYLILQCLYNKIRRGLDVKYSVMTTAFI